MTTSIDHMDQIPPDEEIHHTFWKCLLEAELAFGPRSPSWQYTVRLRSSPGYPETVPNGTTAVVSLNRATRVGCLFEAGHEAVHCLNPGSDATYLEEAVTVAFSQWLVAGRFGQVGLGGTKLPKDYKSALHMAAIIDEDVINLGRRLRGCVGSLRAVSAEVIRELYPRTPDTTVQMVLSTFPRQP